MIKIAEINSETQETDKYYIAEVAKEIELSAVDVETNKPITQLDLLVKIANDLEEIKKQIVS